MKDPDLGRRAHLGQPVLDVRAAAKHYGTVRALDGVDFQLRDREVHALIGDNGAGKSTLVKILSGAIVPDEGSIEILGQAHRFESPADARAAGVETVYQDLALASTLSAADNIYLGREELRPGWVGRLGFMERATMRRRATEQLAGLGIELKSDTAPIEALSGGQRQAVAIARAAFWGSHVLIMDEPTAALGHKQTEVVIDLIRRVRDDHGLSVMLISHSMPDVMRVADRITVLRHGRDVLTVDAREATTEMLVGAMTGATADDTRGPGGEGTR